MEGYYELSYSSGIGSHPGGPDKWPVRVVTPQGGRINAENGHAQLILPGLLPDLEYFLRVSVVLSDLSSPVVGDIINVRTLAPPPPPSPDIEYLDMELTTSEITTDSVRLTWRYLKPAEKTYIDGIQLRYLELRDNKPVSSVPETSPFIHRDTNYYVLENLQPDTQYEVDADLLPVPNSMKEFFHGKPIEFRTQKHVDKFNFDIQLRVEDINSSSAVITWSGVPSPDQQFVNIYRVIYHAGHPNSIRDESSDFKIPKIDSPKRIEIGNLLPGIRYQVWIEAYLTNGKTKKTNVEEFETLPGEAKLPSEAQPNKSDPNNDYYNSMVAAAIVAAFAILAFLIVLYFYLRRNITYKATITKDPPKFNPAYDNRGFKDFESERSSVSQTSQNIEMNGINGNAPNCGSIENGTL